MLTALLGDIRSNACFCSSCQRDNVATTASSFSPPPNNVHRGGCRDLLTFMHHSHSLTIVVGEGVRGGGGGVRLWRARWRRRGAVACDKGGGSGVRRRHAALLRDEQGHVEGEMKRYVKVMSGHKFAERGGDVLQICF